MEKYVFEQNQQDRGRQMKRLHGKFRKVTSVLVAGSLSIAFVPCPALAETAGQDGGVEAATPETSTATASASTSTAIDDELIVTYKTDKSIKNIVKRADVDADSTEKLMDDADGSDISLVKLDRSQDSGDAIEALEADPRVESVERNMTFHALSTSVNDTYASQSYYLQTEGIADAWDVSKSEGTVTVAVLDSGVTMNSSYRDPDLENTVDFENAYDATDESTGALESSFTDTCGHGTAVSELISAEANNAEGIAGTSYNAKVLPVRVLNDEGEGSTAEILRGYRYVLEHASELNVKVINMSLGGETDASEARQMNSLQTAVNTAYQAGILTVAAAGNEADPRNLERGETLNPVEYPAALDHVLAVGAVDSSGTVASFSEHHSYVDLVAAGVNVYVPWFFKEESSTSPGWDWSWGWGFAGGPWASSTAYVYTPGNYVDEDGTSFSAPIVSGAAALLYAHDDDATAAEVENSLESSAVDRGASGKDDYYGYGELDAAAALEALPGADERIAEQEEKASEEQAARERAFKAAKSKITSKKAAKKSVKLKWKSVKNATGYRVYYRVKGSSKWKSASSSKTSKTISKLKRKTRYQFRVRGEMSSSSGSTIWGKYSSTVTVKTK